MSEKPVCCIECEASWFADQRRSRKVGIFGVVIVAIMWVIGMITVIIYNVENKDDDSESELINSIDEAQEDQGTQISIRE